MVYDHISIGGGVIGINTTINLLKKFLKSKLRKKIKLCVVDKHLSNIPGGIAYGKKTSTHGYFNNPLRLSHLELQKYFRNVKNFEKLKDYLNIYGSNYDIKKFNKNLNILKTKNKKKINELYLPRVAFSFLQENSLLKILNKIKKQKKKIQLDFYEGEVKSFKKNKIKNLKIFPLKKFSKFKLIINKTNKVNISFQTNNKTAKILSCKNMTIGLGVTPPKKLVKNEIYNKNYIWDFYAEGGTSYLIKKINDKLKSKKSVKLCFIGSKAGFLESLQEIYNLRKNNKNLKIFCFSKKFETLQPAKISFKKKIKLKFLKKNNKSILSAEKLFNEIEKELGPESKNNNTKYLIWTKILSSNILDYFLKKLPEEELIVYQKKYFHKIRDLTRFTFPDTIKVKDNMIKKKMIKIIREKVHKIKLSKEFINLYGEKKKYTFDVVVNVTGPCNLVETSRFLSIYKSILKLNIGDENVIADKNFSLIGTNNLFVPGTITRGFNDQRKTIIKAIINNSNKSSLQIYKRILGKN